MFFSALILSNKGPLGKVWLAAHYHKKLSKKDIININVSKSVEAILYSRIILSLRTSSHLLLGISYLHNKQVSYLLRDALEYAYSVPSFIAGQSIDLDEQSAPDINLPDGDDLKFLISDDIFAGRVEGVRAKRSKLQGELSEILDDEFVNISGGPVGNESIHLEEIVFEDIIYTDDGFGGLLNPDPTTIFDIQTGNDNGIPQSLFTSKGQHSTESLKDKHKELDEYPEEQQEQVNQVQENLNMDANQQVQQDLPQIVYDLYEEPTQPVSREDDHINEVEPHLPVNENENLLRPEEPSSRPSIEEARQASSMGLSRIEARDGDLILHSPDPVSRQPRRRKAGRVLIDKVNVIPREEYHERFEKVGKLMTQREPAPATKHLLKLKSTGTTSALLANPSVSFSSRVLANRFNEIVKTSRAVPILEDLPNDWDLFEQNENDQNRPELVNETSERKEHQPILDEQLESEEIPIVLEEVGVPYEPSIKESAPAPRQKRFSQSPERASQRRRKQPRLSQEQVRRGTIFYQDRLYEDSIVEFEKTQMEIQSSGEANNLFSQSQSQDFTSSIEEGLLSQLSQTMAEPLYFSNITQGFNRRKAAKTFFQLLTLHKCQAVILNQKKYYGEILITKGPNFRPDSLVY